MFRHPLLPINAIVCLCLACLVSAGCFNRSSDLTTETWSDKNRAIALLENGAETDKKGSVLNESAEKFRNIAKQYPSERLGLQNLCIVLLSRLKLLDPIESSAEYESIGEEFEKSVASLKRITPTEPDADTLASRYYQLKNDRDAAVQSMRDAARTANARADTFFQLIELLRSEQTLEGSGEMLSILESALKLAPNNLILAVTYLDGLAKSHDSRFEAQAERCRELFRPIMSRTNSVISTLLDKGIAAAKGSDWKTAQTQLAFLQNVLRPEIAVQNDRNLLEPHILDYVVLEFQSLKRTSRSQVAKKSRQRFGMARALPFLETNVQGMAAEDFDLDGQMDLVCIANEQVQVWSWGKPSGNTLGPEKKLCEVSLEIECHGIALADLDHDYQFRKDALPTSALPTTSAPDAPPSQNAMLVDTDMDVVAYGKEGVRLFRNELDGKTGARSLVPMPQEAELNALRNVNAVALIDMDHDSDLDLAIATEQGLSLWSNRGNWTFADFSSFSNLPRDPIRSILAMDLDRNVLNDFLLGGAGFDEPIFLDNNLHGRYKPRDMNWGKQLAKSCQAIEALDVNGDACWDLVMCGEQGTRLVHMKSVGHHDWGLDKVTKLSDKPMHGILSIDVDFDGRMDCIAWGKKGIELFRGTPDGRCEVDEARIGKNESIQQLVVLDLDRDGDEDVISLNDQGVAEWIENQDGNSNQSVEVVIRADEDGLQTPRERCNMHGVGSLIELKSGGDYQARIVRGTRTKFGLGQNTGAEIMRILWTNGIPNNVLHVSNRSTVFDQQNLGGSCPYLYAWNGERFEFCTDCLWAAPIGLQFAQGVAAPTRDWEYLKIDGAQLMPKDGQYILQVTEELWEAAYFDAVELMAIDHPKEIDVYTNEKVGPSELAEFRVFTVENRRTPNKVVDQLGNDLLERVAKRDRRYTRAWSKGFNQGLVEEHWLEIDLNATGKASDEIVLYLTGWVFPTCTSLNLAMSENPLRPKLKPPSIHVPNERGEWIEVVPYAGFPGGKTKTIAVDLSGKFLSSDHRVRVVTNMELCWDEVFWTADETKHKQELYHLTKLELNEADLHFRGFSELKPQPGNAPKRFEYDQVTRESIWPPMTGAFTKYGPVRELIQQADDRQVVMGAGDELTLAFSKPSIPLPDGWTRDFIIYNVGWDKDADLNTIHGQDAGPLPFRSMKRYPYEPDESFPSSPAHVDFLERFQTRVYSGASFWNQIRDAQ